MAQMDLTTQQNLALVEQATAASHALEQQAGTLAAAVAVFRLQAPAAAAAPVKAPVPAELALALGG